VALNGFSAIVRFFYTYVTYSLIVLVDSVIYLHCEFTGRRIRIPSCGGVFAGYRVHPNR
jgi:hypothetical protein